LNPRQFDVRNYFIDDTDVVLVRSTIYKLIILTQQYRMVLYFATLSLLQGVFLTTFAKFIRAAYIRNPPKGKTIIQLYLN